MKRIGLIVLLCAVVMLGWSQPKYVFYFIGDGMGPNNVMAAQMYLSELQGKIGVERLTMTMLPFTGQLSTFSTSNGITDSSAAGTCLATGTKTNNGTLGLDVVQSHRRSGTYLCHRRRSGEFYRLERQQRDRSAHREDSSSLKSS